MVYTSHMFHFLCFTKSIILYAGFQDDLLQKQKDKVLFSVMTEVDIIKGVFEEASLLFLFHQLKIVTMILARIQEEENQEISSAHKEKGLTKFRTRAHHPHFSIHSRHTFDQPSSSSPSRNPSLSPENRLNTGRTISPDRPQRTCSNFMKNFIQKLKKQRKRQRKKVNEMNQKKQAQKQSTIRWDIAPLPIIQHGRQQILVLQRINPAPFKSALIQPVPSLTTIASDKIQDIISQIKYHKQKIGRQTIRKRLSEGLPLLQAQKSERVRTKKKATSIQNLDPWEGDNTHNDLILE